MSRRNSHRRPTGADVARLAEVAQSSVSLVFSGKSEGRVSAELETRIRDAAKQLGYHPLYAGQALRSGRTFTLGLAVTDFENIFFGSLSRGAQERASEYSYSVMLMEARYEEHVFAPYRALDGGHVDGLLVFGIDPPPRDEQQRFRVTLIECEREGYASAVFSVDDGLLEAVQYLKSLSHTRIAYLGVNNRRWAFERRRNAWQSAMQTVGLTYPEGYVAECAISLDSAIAAARDLLAGSSLSRPTAIVCGDDLMAAGVYAAAAGLDIRIPSQLSVVSFGGTILGKVLGPALTTISASARDLGAAAVDLQMNTTDKQRAQLPVSLEIRGSTSLAPVETIT